MLFILTNVRILTHGKNGEPVSKVHKVSINYSVPFDKLKKSVEDRCRMSPDDPRYQAEKLTIKIGDELTDITKDNYSSVQAALAQRESITKESILLTMVAKLTNDDQPVNNRGPAHVVSISGVVGSTTSDGTYNKTPKKIIPASPVSTSKSKKPMKHNVSISLETAAPAPTQADAATTSSAVQEESSAVLFDATRVGNNVATTCTVTDNSKPARATTVTACNTPKTTAPSADYPSTPAAVTPATAGGAGFTPMTSSFMRPSLASIRQQQRQKEEARLRQAHEQIDMTWADVGGGAEEEDCSGDEDDDDDGQRGGAEGAAAASATTMRRRRATERGRGGENDNSPSPVPLAATHSRSAAQVPATPAPGALLSRFQVYSPVRESPSQTPQLHPVPAAGTDIHGESAAVVDKPAQTGQPSDAPPTPPPAPPGASDATVAPHGAEKEEEQVASTFGSAVHNDESAALSTAVADVAVPSSTVAAHTGTYTGAIANTTVVSISHTASSSSSDNSGGAGILSKSLFSPESEPATEKPRAHSAARVRVGGAGAGAGTGGKSKKKPFLAGVATAAGVEAQSLPPAPPLPPPPVTATAKTTTMTNSLAGGVGGGSSSKTAVARSHHKRVHSRNGAMAMLKNITPPSTKKGAAAAGGGGGGGGFDSSVGRPSIGTIERQWEFMRAEFMQNDDEELNWQMVSSTKSQGAYNYAHKKVELAETAYFKALYEIELYRKKVETATAGPVSRILPAVTSIANLYQPLQGNPHHSETHEKIDAAQEHFIQLFGESNAALQAQASSIYSKRANENLHSLLFREEERKRLTRHARTLQTNMPVEVAALRTKLSNAEADADKALANMEKWSKREQGAHDYNEAMRQQDVRWMEEQLVMNTQAYTTMRGFVPVNVADLTVQELVEQSRVEGGLLTMELATEVKTNKLLHWLVMHPEDIPRDSFLTGEKKAFFDNMDNLDVTEMRALALYMPLKFENDKDGRKAAWRTRFMARVKQLVSQQQGELVKGGWSPAAHERALVSQPPLKPAEIRRPIYFYRTKEESDKKLEQYQSKQALLEKKKVMLEEAEVAAKDAKTEYDVVLAEFRDPDFISQYGAEQLTKAKALAKQQHTEAARRLKQLKTETHNLEQSIRRMPVSMDEFQVLTSELRAYLREERDIDWTQPGLSPVPIEEMFDPAEQVPKIDRDTASTARFMSAEEEAALRRQEVESLKMSRSTRKDQDGEERDTGDVVRDSTGAAGASTGSGRLPVDAFDLFSPPAAAAATHSAMYHDIGTPTANPILVSSTVATGGTPVVEQKQKRKNSVLLNANPDMLNTLNKMLGNAASNSSAVAGANNTRTRTRTRIGGSDPMSEKKQTKPSNDTEPTPAAEIKEKKTTKSNILQRLLVNSLSPKRERGAGGGAEGRGTTTTTTTGTATGGPMMSLLGQIKNRVGLTNKKHAAAAAAPVGDGGENSENQENRETNLSQQQQQACAKDPQLGAPAQAPQMSLFEAIRKRRVED